MLTKEKFVIIDGNAIIHRAYHALPPLTAQDGRMVNAVYGFTSMLLKVLHDLKPEYIAVAFDVAGPTFRDAVYKEYKAKRVKADQALYDQIPLVHQVVRALGIGIFTKEGFEADDVIGTVATYVEKTKKNIQTIIVTGDRDFLQLVDDDLVEVYLLKKGMSDFELYNEAKVLEHFGFGPKHVVDYKALRGDTSDNIPGVPGIGEKTATELIQKFGTIEEIYKKIQNAEFRMQNEMKPNVLKKLQEGEESGKMSKELASIRRDVEGLEITLEKCKTPVLSRDKLAPLFQKFSFVSLLKRIPDSSGQLEETKKVVKKTLSRRKLIIVNKENFETLLAEFQKTKTLYAKEIVQGKPIPEGDLSGFVFGTEGGEWFVSLSALSKEDSKKLFQIFSNEKVLLVGHDIKELVKGVGMLEVEVKNKLFDTMIASYIINSSTRAHDLTSLVLRELGQSFTASTEQSSLFGIDPNMAADEVRFIRQLHQKFIPGLREKSDEGLFEKIEMALIPVLAEMELHGVAVDIEMLQKLSKEIQKEIAEITKKIYTEAGEEFNVASSTQLRDILFEKMGLPTQGIKKGKTGYSTAAPELEKLREESLIIPLIEEHRELSKLQNTYVDVLPTLINKTTGRIHTHFNQAVAATGRLSSSDPNLQNIPIRTELGREIRNTFIAEPGNVLISADYSQIELRIVASLANDETMIDIFKHGKDIHTATAAAINGVPLEDVTKEMRRAAKEVNFGVLYGMGAYGLAWRAGIPQNQAKEFIQKYFEQFSGVKKYIDQTIKFAKEEGYVETLFGRRRYIPELLSDNFQMRNSGERMAVNMPIQGTAADLMKMAMIAVDQEIKKAKNLKNKDVRMILQVHDELVLEVKKGLEDEVGEMVKKTMEGVAKLRVPIEVSVHAGKRWGEMK